MTKKKKDTLKLRIDRRILMYQVGWWMWKLNVISRFKRWFHCRKGWHHLTPEYLETATNGRCTFKCRWLRCLSCNKLFFTSKEDREKYQRHLDKEEKVKDKLMDMTVAKTIADFKEEQEIKELVAT